MVFKYWLAGMEDYRIHESDIYKRDIYGKQTYTFLQAVHKTTYCGKGSELEIVVTGNSDHRIYRFEPDELLVTTKLEQVLK